MRTSFKEFSEGISLPYFVTLHVYVTSIQDLSMIFEEGVMHLPCNENLKISLERKTGEHKMNVKLHEESSASLDSLFLPLHVVVGELEMSVRELLDLEEGREISLALPGERQVQLYLGGELIADAVLLTEDNSSSLKILSVHLQLEDEISDNRMSAEKEHVLEQ